MPFTISIETDNAAFADETGEGDGQTEKAHEVQRIVRIVVDKIGSGYTSGPLYDSNGNAVGSWDLS